jgi:poly-gamma-glutamate synthesis protein (capsule biosynthesis protein)
MFNGVVAERMQAAGDMAWSLRLVQEALGRGDVLFGNFEFPVSVNRRAEPGCRPDRVSSPGIGRALRDAGFHVVNFAHNHLYDFGAEGVESTLRDMADGGPACVGVGRTAAEARRPLVIDTPSGQPVGFLAYATAHMAVDRAHQYVGCFPHIPTVQADVAALRPSVNAVVVSCHTGAQFNPYPAPETRALARAAIQAGASVFLGHHPHVPQGYERIDHGLAVYSLGNFVASSRREETRQTFIVRIALQGDRVASHEIVTCYIGDDGRTVLAEGDLGRAIAARIERLSEDIAEGRSDDLHFDFARSRMGSHYAATWIREFRRGGPGVILRKLRHLRPYHATLVARMLRMRK